MFVSLGGPLVASSDGTLIGVTSFVRPGILEKKLLVFKFKIKQLEFIV